MKELGKNWKVCVQSWTYNQAQYIEDTLNGFVTQRTDFPFVCCIIDDASTDGEQDVIKHYMQENFCLQDNNVCRIEENDDYRLLFAQHKTNKQCYFTALLLNYNHYSIKKSTLPYIKEWNDNAIFVAYCEGDDYWIDSMKLKKQVDFMNAHPSHSMCFHAVQFLFPNGETKESHRYDYDKEECDIRDILLTCGGYAKVCSMLYDREKYGDGYDEWTKNPSVGDWPLQVTLFVKGKVAYMNETMSTYRVSAEGSWTQKMSEDYHVMRNHHKSVALNWKLFDKWTEGKYHDCVKFQLADNKKVYRNRQIDYLSKYTVIKYLRKIISFFK